MPLPFSVNTFHPDLKFINVFTRDSAVPIPFLTGISVSIPSRRDKTPDVDHALDGIGIGTCNPYFIIHTRPRLFIIHYYTLNDGLSTMTFEWLTRSYLSWNYTGHGQTIFPITKIEIDLRTKYIFHLHTTTFKYSSIYNNNKHQLILRRQPISEYADDHYELKLKYYHNRTFLIHLQVINNHYEIIGNSNSDDLFWKLHGYFRKDQFNGSLLLSNNDWYLSSKLNINSSLYISTG
ncbi:unnamed protein product, partial [Adineta steineri]